MGPQSFGNGVKLLAKTICDLFQVAGIPLHAHVGGLIALEREKKKSEPKKKRARVESVVFLSKV